MNKSILCAAACAALANPAIAGGMEDDPLLGKVMIDQLELRSTNGPDPLVIEAQAWLGKDLHKLWLKADIEQVDGNTEESELQALYSRAISPYWDLQLGWRHDFRPAPDRDWLAIGVHGLAPYWFEIDTALFVGEDSRVAARLEAEYEWMFTQRWVLSPDLTINLHADNDPATGTGAGLSDMQLGLRLRYEIRREFAPYIGLNWTKSFGRTADYARQEGADTNDLQIVAGIRAWF